MSTEGVLERTSWGAPCIFCGNVGRDIRVHYASTDEVVHWCHYTKASYGDEIMVGGDTYYCCKENYEHEVGTFNFFKKRLTKEEWIEKQKRLNPNWKPSKNWRNNTKKDKPRMLSVTQVCNATQPAEKVKLIGEEDKLPNKQLDKIYRAMLDMLVLEDKHKEALLKEWKSPVYDVSCLLSDYPIRSLPPVDEVRFANKETFKNPTRKHIISKLLSMFGDLRGVPGFYLETGPEWKDKSEKERWAFSKMEGMIFPCIDEYGYLYSIRIRDDYPDRKLEEGKTDSFNGMYGRFHHFYDKNKQHCWVFRQKGKDAKVIYNVKPFGKVDGKYKCFSSVYGEMIDKQRVNTMEGGSSSGAPYSLYDKYSNNYTVVFATEGEKKAMVANAVKHFPVVSVAGVGNFKILFQKGDTGKSFIETMQEKGMKYMIVCYDADKDDKESVKKAETSFVAALKEHGVEVRIGYWKKDFDKGLDDILLAGVDILIGPA